MGLGVSKRRERVRDAIQTHRTGHQRLPIELAIRDRLQCFGKFLGRNRPPC